MLTAFADAIDTHGFADKTVTISNDYEAVRKTLEGRALFAVSSTKRLEEMRTSGEPLSKHYGFQVPDPIPGEPLESSPDFPGLSERDVQTFHAAGLAVIVAVNTFLYSSYPGAKRRHMELARRDINRFRAAGVDGFQIDSCYQDFVF